MTDPISPEALISSDASSPHEAGRIVRQLGGFEELVYLYTADAPIAHTYAVVLEGATAVDTWRQAWRDLRRHHRILSSTMRKVSGRRPMFVIADRSAPMTVRAADQAVDLDAEMAAELGAPLRGCGDALYRLTLLHARDRCTVLLTGHHAASDGRTSILILQDLLGLVAGKAVAPTGNGDEVPWPTREALFDRSDPVGYEPREGKMPPPQPDAAVLPSIKVRHLSLTEAETTRLLERAKSMGVSVHAALMAAAVRAVSPHRPGAAVLRCATPIDLRPLVDAPGTTGMLISNFVGEVEVDASFWDAARRAGRDVGMARTPEAVARDVDAVRALTATERTSGEALDFLQQFPFDLMVTNMGGSRFRVDHDGIAVTDVRSATAGGPPSMQTISVVTSRDRLGLTLGSREPIPSLLEDVKDALNRA